MRDALIRVRRPKDDVELERMRAAAEATRAGFAELVPLIAAGRSERELQIALEASFLRNGGDFLAFETIVAAGDHAAVLHFSPTARELRDGDLLLVDAGAEYRGYASDVTRTYAVGGTFSAEQALVYDTVRRAGEAAIAACRPGTEWHDVHRTAALVVAEGLVELSVLRGSPETLVESGAATLFFPHGVGHLVGLGVRDTGLASDEAREPVPGLPRLRVDIPLRPRQAWTVEPGIYVVPALLAGERGHEGVDWHRVDELHGFGGVRLEQNVLITDGGCELLTAAVPLLGGEIGRVHRGVLVTGEAPHRDAHAEMREAAVEQHAAVHRAVQPGAHDRAWQRVAACTPGQVLADQVHRGCGATAVAAPWACPRRDPAGRRPAARAPGGRLHV